MVGAFYGGECATGSQVPVARTGELTDLVRRRSVAAGPVPRWGHRCDRCGLSEPEVKLVGATTNRPEGPRGHQPKASAPQRTPPWLERAKASRALKDREWVADSVPISFRPYRPDLLSSDATQGGARLGSLALGHLPVPRWSNPCDLCTACPKRKANCGGGEMS